MALTANFRSCLNTMQYVNVVSFTTTIPFGMLWLGILFGDLLRAITGWEQTIILVVVLLISGARLLIKAFRSEAEEKAADLRSFKMVILISLAFGMNALILGTGLAFMEFDRSQLYLYFCVISVTLSLIGILIGKKYGAYSLANKAEFLGGFLFIGIGIKYILQLVSVI